MNALIATIDAAVETNNYGSLAQVFSVGPSSWQSLGQGEQRSLAAHFIKAVVTSSSLKLQQALGSDQMMSIFLETLNHLPTTPVDGAADNKLRQSIFDYKVNEEGDYAAAARVLSGMRMEDDQQSVYYFTPADKCEGTVLVCSVSCWLHCVVVVLLNPMAQLCTMLAATHLC